MYLVSTESKVQTFAIPSIRDGKAFWLDDRTIAHAVSEGEGKDSVIAIYSLSVKSENEALSTPNSPILIGKLPTDTAADFVFNSKSGYLVFSDQVYSDGDIHAAKEHDKRWDNRGNSALVYEDTYIRHWNTWSGPKKASLFSIALYTDSTGKWVLGTEYVNLLKGTKHVRYFTVRYWISLTPSCSILLSRPSEVLTVLMSQPLTSHTQVEILYSRKCFTLNRTWDFNKRDIGSELKSVQVYLIGLDGKSERKELTTGDHGMTDSIIFNPTGDKVAWVELTTDGSEAAQ
jgi:hypothetical protein